MKIYKYEIERKDTQVINMTAGAKILSFQVQNGLPVIWALTEEDGPTVKRRFNLYGTGHTLSDIKQEYIGTVQMFDGDLVLHLFEVFGK